MYLKLSETIKKLRLIGKFNFTDIDEGLSKTIKWFKESKFGKYY